MVTVSKRTLNPQPDTSPYRDDFYSWTIEQAGLLRAGRVDLADLHNIADEIEALGNEQSSKLRSAYRLIAMHLLKMLFQPELSTRSWHVTIVRERLNIEDILSDSPGLKPRREDLFAKAYGAARKEAAAETGLPLNTFPVEPPFTADQAEDEAFWPRS